MQQVDFIDAFLARRVSGTWRPSSGALDVELQHTVFCTAACVVDLRGGSQDRRPSKKKNCAEEYINKITLLYQVGISHYL